MADTTNPKPWQTPSGAPDGDAAFLAWIDSADGSAELERRLILGDTPIADPRRSVHIARMAFYAGRLDGVALASGKQQHEWPRLQSPPAGLDVALAWLTTPNLQRWRDALPEGDQVRAAYESELGTRRELEALLTAENSIESIAAALCLPVEGIQTRLIAMGIGQPAAAGGAA